MKLKKIFIAFIPVFIAIIIIFASNTNIDKMFSNKKPVEKQLNKDSIRKADSIMRQYLLGHFDPSKDTAFILLKSPYTNSANMYLRKDVFKAYKIMYDSAKKDGVNLLIISATRNFDQQKSIWEGKFKGTASAYPDTVKRAEQILKYSSMPGTSRHHWGTDIDLNSVQLSSFETPSGKKLYKWLSENANKYGFCQPYTKKDSTRKTGYEEEKWHWSYHQVSSVLLDYYNSLVSYNDIKGFSGCETAEKIKIIENFVNGVNKNCH